MQFMNEENSCLVQVDERGEQIPLDWSVQAAGHRWALPLVPSARRCLQQVAQHLQGTSLAPWVTHSRSAIFPPHGLLSNGQKMLTLFHTIATSHDPSPHTVSEIPKQWNRRNTDIY